MASPEEQAPSEPTEGRDGSRSVQEFIQQKKSNMAPPEHSCSVTARPEHLNVEAAEEKNL